MKAFLLVLCTLFGMHLYAQDTNAQNQDPTTVKGKIISTTTNGPLVDVNIVNINQVIGTTTNNEGDFEIRAKANDTLQ